MKAHGLSILLGSNGIDLFISSSLAKDLFGGINLTTTGAAMAVYSAIDKYERLLKQERIEHAILYWASKCPNNTAIIRSEINTRGDIIADHPQKFNYYALEERGLLELITSKDELEKHNHKTTRRVRVYFFKLTTAGMDCLVELEHRYYGDLDNTMQLRERKVCQPKPGGKLI